MATRYIFAVFCLLLLACKSTNKKGETDILKFPKVVDFGQIKAGTTKLEKIELSNNTGDNIRISEIGSSCSCSAADEDKILIEPYSKEEIELKVTMDSSKNTISEILTLKQEKPTKFYFIQIKAQQE